MARSVNRVTLLGNLGQDPDVRSTPSGASVATLNVATTESYKDRNDEWQENTDWHRVVLWNRLADVASQYLKKGDRVYIEGKISTRSYEKEGQTRYITEIRASKMIMLGGSQGGGRSSQAPQQQKQQKPQAANDNNENYNYEVDTSDEYEDDDVPF